ncbi:MAG: hypothetical protein KGD59_03050 [Candidatus Heimdallarchaeota archaeon]|nr:hypothetical protein [Candidatus Heimdallarchaeota archaeon]MBY8993500.1 hypothetical protein [Candidatus Heimdallarchaeota archaeon]
MTRKHGPLYSDPFVSKWLDGFTDKQKANKIHKFRKYSNGKRRKNNKMNILFKQQFSAAISFFL